MLDLGEQSVSIAPFHTITYSLAGAGYQKWHQNRLIWQPIEKPVPKSGTGFSDHRGNVLQHLTSVSA